MLATMLHGIQNINKTHKHKTYISKECIWMIIRKQMIYYQHNCKWSMWSKCKLNNAVDLRDLDLRGPNTADPSDLYKNDPSDLYNTNTSSILPQQKLSITNIQFLAKISLGKTIAYK